MIFNLGAERKEKPHFSHSGWTSSVPFSPTAMQDNAEEKGLNIKPLGGPRFLGLEIMKRGRIIDLLYNKQQFCCTTFVHMENCQSDSYWKNAFSLLVFEIISDGVFLFMWREKVI